MQPPNHLQIKYPKDIQQIVSSGNHGINLQNDCKWSIGFLTKEDGLNDHTRTNREQYTLNGSKGF